MVSCGSVLDSEYFVTDVFVCHCKPLGNMVDIYPSLETVGFPVGNYQHESEPFTSIIAKSGQTTVLDGHPANGSVRYDDSGHTGDDSVSKNSTRSKRTLSVVSIDSGLGEQAESFLGTGTEEDGAEVDNQTEPSEHDFWKKILVIFLVLDVLLFGTIFTVAFGIPAQRNGEQTEYGNRHCLDCLDVYLTEDDRNDNIYSFNQRDSVGGGQICCSENERKLIQKYVIKRYRSDQAKASAKRYVPKRTAVHLLLDRTDTASETKGNNQTLKWTREGSLINGNLSLSSDGRHIVVKREGIYYISPKVVFGNCTVETQDHHLEPVLLQVFQSRSGREQLLLENKHTHCADSVSSCAMPSSGQGVFRLETEDILSVRVSKSCGLVREPGAMNYIDVYMI